MSGIDAGNGARIRSTSVAIVSLLVALAACRPDDPFRIEAAAAGPEFAITAEDGEIPVRFVVTLTPEASRQPARKLDFGWSTGFVFTGTGVVRAVVFSPDDDGLVPTPWDFAIAETGVVTRAAGDFACSGVEPTCAETVEMGLEVREGGPLQATWTVSVWAAARKGQPDDFDEATSLEIAFEEPL